MLRSAIFSEAIEDNHFASKVRFAHGLNIDRILQPEVISEDQIFDWKSVH